MAKTLLVLFSVVLLAVALFAFGVNYRYRRLMAPYVALCDRHAAEAEVVGRLGAPEVVVRDLEQLRRISEGWSPMPPMLVESRVLVYRIPLPDELQIYLYVNRKGVVDRMAVAGT